MGPQQSSSPPPTSFFQVHLSLRCVLTLGLCHYVRPVFATTGRPWRRPTTFEMGVPCLGLNP